MACSPSLLSARGRLVASLTLLALPSFLACTTTGSTESSSSSSSSSSGGSSTGATSNQGGSSGTNSSTGATSNAGTSQGATSGTASSTGTSTSSGTATQSSSATSGTVSSGGSSQMGTSSSGPAVFNITPAAGGTVTAPGLILEIPPGAVTSPVDIHVTVSSAPMAGLALLSSVYTFEPDGLTFLQPVRVSMDASMEAATRNAAIYWTMTGQSGVTALATERDGTTLSALITHFSSGFVGWDNSNACVNVQCEDRPQRRTCMAGKESWGTQATCENGMCVYVSLDVDCGALFSGATCMDDRCMLPAGFCTAPSADCDGEWFNTCETNLNTNILHCGACGNACVPGSNCNNGACACPANCSAHGTCNSDGACECAIGFSGPDCSVEMCPTGCSCPASCSGHGTCEIRTGACTCDSQHAGNDCSQLSCPGDCSGHGTCDGGTGVCTCDQTHQGSDCSQLRCPGDCNGHGTCAQATGVCTCQDGFGGAACNQLACPNDCGGAIQGTCNGATGVCACTNPNLIPGACEVAMRIDASEDNTCISAAGRPTCWGQGQTGINAPPMAANYVSTMSVGPGSVACGVDASFDKVLVCWGNAAGGLQPLLPVDPIFKQVGVGLFHVCAVDTARKITCVGLNTGRDGMTVINQNVAPSGTYNLLSVGDYHSCAVAEDLTLTCWGENDLGQSTPPTGKFTAVSAGDGWACAVKTNGEVACWGQDKGTGNLTPAAGKFRQVSVGVDHACGIHQDGTVECWGGNDAGQATPPAAILANGIAVGRKHGCAHLQDTTVVCWGSNANGQATAPTGGF